MTIFLAICIYNLIPELTYFCPDDGGNMFFQNVGMCIQNCKVTFLL
jgi:hypothetical protein